MQQVQTIFDRLKKSEKEMKDIKAIYSDALKQNTEYQNLVDKIKDLQVRKKQIELSIKQDFSKEFEKLDDLKIDLESDRELLTDAVMTAIMKGEAVEIKDEHDQKYEPTFKVKFKKE